MQANGSEDHGWPGSVLSASSAIAGPLGRGAPPGRTFPGGRQPCDFCQNNQVIPLSVTMGEIVPLERSGLSGHRRRRP